MKSLDDAILFVKTWDGAIDDRDKGRFLQFVPFARRDETGLQFVEGITEKQWGDVKEWTEANVLVQLKSDVAFGMEKANNERGISSSCMFSCVEMWNALLENDLTADYAPYGLPLFKLTAKHYGF